MKAAREATPCGVGRGREGGGPRKKAHKSGAVASEVWLVPPVNNLTHTTSTFCTPSHAKNRAPSRSPSSPPATPSVSPHVTSFVKMAASLLRRPLLLLAMASGLMLLLGTTCSAAITGGGERSGPSPGAALRGEAKVATGSGGGVVSVDATLGAVAAKQVIDVPQMNAAIREVARNAANRADFTRGAAGRAAGLPLSNGQPISSRYNVLVFNLEVRYSQALRGVVYRQGFRFAGRTYELWIFRDGWFRNEGDGGFINWAFTGSFDKRDNFVQFKPRG